METPEELAGPIPVKRDLGKSPYMWMDINYDCRLDINK